MSAKKSLLLHVCCGPCAIHPIETMSDRYDVAAIFYNPNIHPDDEYARRLSSAKSLCESEEVRFLTGPYEPEQYFHAIGDDESKPARCAHCYELRLSATAAAATELEFDAFTTTLLVSPHQDRQAILAAGEAAEQTSDATFLGEDFRDGFREAQRISRDRGMYRQDYCGCRFSKTEAAEERETRRKKRQ